MRPRNNRHDRVIRNTKPPRPINPQLRINHAAQLNRPHRTGAHGVPRTPRKHTPQPPVQLLATIRVVLDARADLDRVERLDHGLGGEEAAQEGDEDGVDAVVDGIRERAIVDEGLDVAAAELRRAVVIGRDVHGAARELLQVHDAEARASREGDFHDRRRRAVVLRREDLELLRVAGVDGRV